jgi:serine/threonine-protein kinase
MPSLSDPLDTLKAALADHYAIERELGRGGMATVYLARDLKHERPVALKVLHPELAATLGPERFLQEIRLAARLQHPHILTVLDSGTAAGRLWFTMPFVEGESLRDRLMREKQLPVDEAVRVTVEAARALDFAHRHGVIHRDIKPENILLCDAQALVADFGIGRALGAPAPGEQLTETGTVVGTPAYMSPEQASGERDLDGRTDIYSLGLVLHEMLAGEPPFTGPTAQAILSRKLTTLPRPLRELRDMVPPAVEHAVLRAIARTPADRFRSAGEFAQALVSEPMTTAVASRPALAAARRRLSRRALAIVAGAVLLLAGAVIALRRSGDRPVPLDSSLVAVAPFDVLQPAHALWREGLVDLLSRNLDGAGPLRTVSPTVVVRRWRGRADRAAAEALARGTGAGLVLFGTLLPAGMDSVRLVATVLDVRTGQAAAEADVRGHSGRIDQLADTLTVRVLRGIGQTRLIGAVRTTGMGSRSLPALRAFLRGEQSFRRTQWDSARTHYETAIAEDTAFALAYWRLGTVRGWVYGVNDSLVHVYYLRAGALNHGLAPRESLLIASDSLMATLAEGDTPDSAADANIRRLFRTADQLVQQYPTDPESWVALGEARNHFGSGRGVTFENALDAFARAISLDSAYAPSYLHAVDLAIATENYAVARRYARGFLALRPGGEHAQSLRAVSFLLDSAASVRRMDALLDTLPAPVLFSTYLAYFHVPDREETGIRIMRRLAARMVPEEQWYHDPEIRYSMLVGALAYRGHLREAASILAARDDRSEWPVYVELALLKAVPAETVDAVLSRRLNKKPFWPPEGTSRAAAWWFARGDSTSLARYLRYMRDAARSEELATNHMVKYRTGVADAYLTLARGDTAGALTKFQALPITTGEVWLERLTLVRLLAAQRRDREALAILDRGFPHPYATPSMAPWALEQARLAERLGEREKASHWYGYVAAVWRQADPELQPTVVEAREALRRLTDERSGS